MTPTNILPITVPLAVASAVALVTAVLALVPPSGRPALGELGERRRHLLASSELCRALEPALLLHTAWCLAIVDLCPSSLRGAFERLSEAIGEDLSRSAQCLGLSAHELIALSCLSSVMGAGLGGFIGVFFDAGPLGGLLGVGIGAVYLRSHVRGVAERRARSMGLGLPAAIDLLAMCVEAGLDFPGAIRLVATGAQEGNVIAQEFGRVLGALELGQTRKAAFRAMSARMQTPDVTEFVRALTQAEDKGSPIALALKNQAGMSRMRRSTRAEEAAARAGVFMMLPMILLLGCVLLLLMGPILCGGVM